MHLAVLPHFVIRKDIVNPKYALEREDLYLVPCKIWESHLQYPCHNPWLKLVNFHDFDAREHHFGPFLAVFGPLCHWFAIQGSPQCQCCQCMHWQYDICTGKNFLHWQILNVASVTYFLQKLNFASVTYFL